MDKTLLEKYAEVIVSTGINIQEGDRVEISGDVEALELLREIVRLCWRKGAADVLVDIQDPLMGLSKYEEARTDVFDRYPKEKLDFSESLMKAKYHQIRIGAPLLDLYQEVDPERQARWRRTSAKAMEPLMRYMDKGDIKWVVAAAPSRKWAEKVFPHLTNKDAIDALWHQIFKMCRVDHDDPVTAWKLHDWILRIHANWLNIQAFDRLHYSGPGTDLTVGLADQHTWVGGSSLTPDKVAYMANIPTEEIFTAPHALRVDGYVRATKPLIYMGHVLENFTLRFEKGKVVDFSCDHHSSVLEELLSLDEGARRLGEVAIVPNSTPISQSGILFYSTLFDENASCHFALGNSYAESIIGGAEMTKEERFELGGNHSMTHVDFMVGGSELDVVGYKKDGTEVPVLHKGEWAVDL
ncbi:MAG: aminopeptidase [Saccharofermentanales bacterium]|jgi:aminopeptidase